MNSQLSLFPDEPPEPPIETAELAPDAAAVASALPSGLRLGTSSWTFPGWRDLLFRPHGRAKLTPQSLAFDGLAAYAGHPLLRTVGIDRTFYAPIESAVFARYAAAVPADFRFLVKAHQALTFPPRALRELHAPDARGGARGPTAGGAAGGVGGMDSAGSASAAGDASVPHDLFLNAAHARDAVIGPTLEGLGHRAGVILVQFPPLRLRDLGGAERVIEQLHRFLAEVAPLVRVPPTLATRSTDRASTSPAPDATSSGKVGRDLPPGSPSGRHSETRTPRPHDFPPEPTALAIELRNGEFFSGRAAELYRQTLADTGAIHCYNLHPAVPPLETQRALIDPATQRAIVIRWMLRRNHQYEEAAEIYQPFNRLVEPDPGSRADVAILCALAASLERPTWVIVNNKAEGSSPLSVLELAREVVKRTKAGPLPSTAV